MPRNYQVEYMNNIVRIAKVLGLRMAANGANSSMPAWRTVPN